jgi:hypothetical protein
MGVQLAITSEVDENVDNTLKSSNGTVDEPHC